MTKHDKSFPSDEAGRIVKHDILNTHIDSVGPALGLQLADFTSIEDDNKLLHWICNWHTLADEEMIALTEFKKLLLYGEEDTPVQMFNFTVPATAPATLTAGIFERYKGWAKQIKGHKKYTKQVGQLLGFIGAEIVVDPDEIKPTASIKAVLENKVVINILKGNYADGIAVYCHTFIAGEAVPEDPGDDITYDFLGFHTSVPYTDYRLNQKKQPETRIYKFYYMKGDKIIGQASDLLTVVCKVYIAVSGADLSGKVR